MLCWALLQNLRRSSLQLCSLSLCLVPPLHVTVQLVHESHDPQLPATKKSLLTLMGGGFRCPKFRDVSSFIMNFQKIKKRKKLVFHSVFGDLEGAGWFTPPPHSSNIQKPHSIRVKWIFSWFYAFWDPIFSVWKWVYPPSP